MGHNNNFTDDLGNEFPVTFAISGYSDTYSRVSENGLVAQVAYLANDDDSTNPRADFDNFGKMVCFHSNYKLGDTHNYSDPDDFMLSLAVEIDSDIEEKIEALNNDKYQELVDGGMGHYAAADIVSSNIQELVSNTIKDSGAIILPLYLYDHSGLSMSVRSFNDRWDSGQVGVIYATGKQVQDEFGSDPDAATEAATKLLKAEVETYDQHLRGEVYGVNLETFVNIGTVEEPEWESEDIESCWGYFGSEYAQGELKSDFENENTIVALEALAAQKGEEKSAIDEAARLAALAKSFVFEVKSHFEPAAGINDYGDTVTVTVHSGEPGGEPGEFQKFIQDALAEWYDRPVQVVNDKPKPAGPKM